jgi:hypothetical protein
LAWASFKPVITPLSVMTASTGASGIKENGNRFIQVTRRNYPAKFAGN